MCIPTQEIWHDAIKAKCKKARKDMKKAYLKMTAAGIFEPEMEILTNKFQAKVAFFAVPGSFYIDVTV